MVVDLTKNFDPFWLFDIYPAVGGYYRWADFSVSVGADAEPVGGVGDHGIGVLGISGSALMQETTFDYEARVDPGSRKGVTINKGFSGTERVHFVRDFSVAVPNPGNTTYDPSDFVGGRVNVHMYADDGTEAGVVRTLKVRIKAVLTIYEKMTLFFEDVAVRAFNRKYPNTKILNELVSDATYDETRCVPVLFGGYALFETPMLVSGSSHYYILAMDEGYTIDIYSLLSPEQFPDSAWTPSSYSFPQSTINGVRVFQAIIHDSDGDGAADANGIFTTIGGDVLAPRVRARLLDPSPWAAGNFETWQVLSGLVFADTGVHITTEKFDPSGTEGDIAMEGAMVERLARYTWADRFAKMLHGALKLGLGGDREFAPLKKAPVATVDFSSVVQDSFDASLVLNEDGYQGGYYRYEGDGGLRKMTCVSSILAEDLDDEDFKPEPFVLHFHASWPDKITQVYLNRTIDKKATVRFTGSPSLCVANPEDVLQVTNNNYGAASNYEAVIQSLKILPNFSTGISATWFNHAIEDLDDIPNYVYLGPPPTISPDTDDAYWGEGSMDPDNPARSVKTLAWSHPLDGSAVDANRVKNDWETKSADFTAEAGKQYLIDTSAGPITMTLPASPSSSGKVRWADEKGTFGTNALTIARNGEKIQSVSANLTINTANDNRTLEYKDAATGWFFE
jgi:hypothetical protein